MEDTVAKIIKEHRVACITTISLKEILKLFPMQGEPFKYCITSIRAHASSSQSSEPLIDDKDYGILGIIDKRSDSFSLDYTLKFDDDGNPINPLDKDGIKRVITALHKVGFEDAAVEYITVLLRDSKIGELAEIDEELFHLTLTSDPVDGDADRKIIKEHKVNEDLIKYYGFKYRILHCRRLIGRKEELTKSKSEQKPIVEWRGNTLASLKSPIKIAQRLSREHFKPYNLIKTYGVGKEDRLILLGVSR